MANKKWIEVASEMPERLGNHCSNCFQRSQGKLYNRRLDASFLELVYPFEVLLPGDKRVLATVKELEKKLVIAGEVHRYEEDEYDSWICDSNHRNKRDESLPILNLRLSAYYAKWGHREKAFQYCNWVSDWVQKFIHEQIFENDVQISIIHLVGVGTCLLSR